MEVDFLKRIVKEAEKISREKYEVRQKGDGGDLVTSLDLEIEKYLIGQIKESYPDYDIVSEEYNTDSKVTDNCFIIDPIDGTVNFANGLPLWGIQIACRKDGRTIASVIDLPRLGELYYADETGAYMNDKKLSIAETPIKSAIYSIVGKNGLADTAKMCGHSPNYRNLGAASVTFAFVASGRVQGVNFRLEHPWDYEPGVFICKMAGAKVRSSDGVHAAAMNQEFLNIIERETAIKED